MNCEHIRELLSDYLDDTLAPTERQNVLQHLSTCNECRAVLDDYRRFDMLLANLPRVGPDPALRDRIFSSPAYQELVADSHTTPSPALNQKEAQTVPHPRLQEEDTHHRPHLIALPGGRTSSRSAARPARPERKTQHWVQRTMLIMIAASLLLTVGVVSLIGWNVWQHHPQTAALPGAITPPAGLQQNGPLPAGMRFTFLRNGALWSAPSDGSTSIVRLTPPGVTVADNWTVRTTLPGRSAGNILAYIDLQQAYIHTIRSDSQNDSIIQQPLLKPGTATPQVWQTATGTTILNSLSWSQDGTMLAFVADPRGSEQPQLYLYSTDSNQIHAVPLPQRGAASHPTWSPDSKRLAFVLASNGQVSVLDYNTQSNEVLTIADPAVTKASANDSILKLAWAANATVPTITWSTGVNGHVHTIWAQQVGASSVLQPRLLVSGDFVEATLNHAQQNTPMVWLLIASQAGLPGDALRLDLQGNLFRLTSNKQVHVAQWSPDGAYIGYFDALSSGMGTFHALNITTGNDTQIAPKVTTNPTPTWSQDAQHLVYSSGSHLFALDMQNASISRPLKLQGTTSILAWSPASPSQLVVALNKGLYLVDTQHDTSIQLDNNTITSSILWTQIP